MLVVEIFMQIIWPWIQKKKNDYVKQKHTLSIILRHLKMIAIGRLRKDNGEPNLDAVTRFVFHCASKSLSSYLGFYFDHHINWAA